MPSASAARVNVSGPMTTLVPLGSIAGSMPGIGEKGAPVCVPSTTMSAAHAPTLSCLG